MGENTESNPQFSIEKLEEEIKKYSQEKQRITNEIREYCKEQKYGTFNENTANYAAMGMIMIDTIETEIAKAAREMIPNDKYPFLLKSVVAILACIITGVKTADTLYLEDSIGAIEEIIEEVKKFNEQHPKNNK